MFIYKFNVEHWAQLHSSLLRNEYFLLSEDSSIRRVTQSNITTAYKNTEQSITAAHVSLRWRENMNYNFFVGCHHLLICVCNMGLDFGMLNAVVNCLWVRQKWLIDSLIKVNFRAFVFIHVTRFCFGWRSGRMGVRRMWIYWNWLTHTDCADKSEFYTWDEALNRLLCKYGYAVTILLTKGNHRNVESKAFITLQLHIHQTFSPL